MLLLKILFKHLFYAKMCFRHWGGERRAVFKHLIVMGGRKCECIYCDIQIRDHSIPKSYFWKVFQEVCKHLSKRWRQIMWRKLGRDFQGDRRVKDLWTTKQIDLKSKVQIGKSGRWDWKRRFTSFLGDALISTKMREKYWITDVGMELGDNGGRALTSRPGKRWWSLNQYVCVWKTLQ